MSIPAAFITIVFIWSTTPLGIKWSSIGVSYEFGVAARMVIGLAALLIVVRLWRLAMPLNKHAYKVYLATGLPLFIAMSTVYWSAQYIPSGWIAVIFGLSPLFTSLFATKLLGENSFTGARLTGMVLGFSGLIIVFSESFTLSNVALIGVAGVTFSAIAQSFGAVWIKSLKPDMHAISITTGGLLFATPLFILNCVINGGWPESIPNNTLMTILYLAVLGTAVGFPLYFYLLKNIQAERVALVTLITPILALLIGAFLNAELISAKVWVGTAFVLTGLAMYEYGKYLPLPAKVKKQWRTRWNQRPL
jgi:drug/metabolite transporter (DMT)-like permease